jgi:hypothetical protein
VDSEWLVSKPAVLPAKASPVVVSSPPYLLHPASPASNPPFVKPKLGLDVVVGPGVPVRVGVADGALVVEVAVAVGAGGTVVKVCVAVAVAVLVAGLVSVGVADGREVAVAVLVGVGAAASEVSWRLSKQTTPAELVETSK